MEVQKKRWQPKNAQEVSVSAILRPEGIVSFGFPCMSQHDNRMKNKIFLEHYMFSTTAVDLLKTSGYQFYNGSLKELRKELEIFFDNGTMHNKGSILVSPGNPNETWIIFPDDSALVVRPNVIVWRPAPLPPQIMWATRINVI